MSRQSRFDRPTVCKVFRGQFSEDSNSCARQLRVFPAIPNDMQREPRAKTIVASCLRHQLLGFLVMPMCRLSLLSADIVVGPAACGSGRGQMQALSAAASWSAFAPRKLTSARKSRNRIFRVTGEMPRYVYLIFRTSPAKIQNRA